MYVYALVLMAKDAKNYRVVQIRADKAALVDFRDTLNLNQLGMIYEIKRVFMQ